MAIKFPEADQMRYQAHKHMRRAAWLECDGLGFAVLNTTAGDFFGQEGRRCCYGRSGPIVYGELPVARPAPPEGWGFYHGSQWVVLARAAAEWLVNDPAAIRFARHLQVARVRPVTAHHEAHGRGTWTRHTTNDGRAMEQPCNSYMEPP